MTTARGTARRAVLVSAALTGLIALAPAVAPAGITDRAAGPDDSVSASGTTARAAVAPAALAPKCPASTTSDDPGGYAVAVQARINDVKLFNGWDELRQEWVSVTSGVSAQACGLLRLPSLEVSIEPDGLVFDTADAQIKVILRGVDIFPSPNELALELAATGTSVNDLTGVREDGALDLSATTPLQAVVKPGSPAGIQYRCITEAVGTLFTGRKTVVPEGRGPQGPTQQGGPNPEPWTVEGSPLRGTSLIGAKATIVGNDFEIPLFPTDFETCFPGFQLNQVFSGISTEDPDNGGTFYCPNGGFIPGECGPTPRGASWTTGEIEITGVDAGAISDGPPRGSEGAIVDACVPKPGPPFRLGVVGDFSGGGIQVSEGVSVSKVSGKLCGIATVVAAPASRPDATVCTQLLAPREGQQFDGVETTLTLIPGVRSIITEVEVAPEPLEALFCDDGEDGVLEIDTAVKASAVPKLFGTGCLVGPLVANVKGTLTGPLSDSKVRLTSGPFPIQRVQESRLCPSGLARNTNEILQLPIERSVDGLTLDASAKLYLPPRN